MQERYERDEEWDQPAHVIALSTVSEKISPANPAGDETGYLDTQRR
jgi:hypothetical protein